MRDYHAEADQQAEVARRIRHLQSAAEQLDDAALKEALTAKAAELEGSLKHENRKALDGWDALIDRFKADEFVYRVRGREIRQPLYSESLSRLKIPRVSTPKLTDPGDRLRWLYRENMPGSFPYTAGVFPLKRRGEEPKRMFAGEGGPGQTNARFHFLCKGEDVHRLSTAFDSVTLYGEDPDKRPAVSYTHLTLPTTYTV